MNLEQFLVTDPMAVYYLTGQYYACGERMMVLRLDGGKGSGIGDRKAVSPG